MHSFDTHSRWENRPLSLSEAERQDLYGVLDDFFSCFHLQDARELLWDWLVAALSSESDYGTGYARSNLIFVYEKLELLIEAAWCLHRQRKKSMKRKQQLKYRQ